MQSEFAVNIPKLREQSELFLQEAEIANRLSSYLKKIRKTANPEKQALYAELAEQTDELSRFYYQMSKAADLTAIDVTDVLRTVTTELEENVLQNTQKFNLNE